MTISLESLELDEGRRQSACDEIRRNAYFKWQKSGCPAGDSLRFWAEAEKEWIEFHYVPSRPFEETPDDARLHALQMATTHELVAI